MPPTSAQVARHRALRLVKRADDRQPTRVELARVARLFDAAVAAWGGSDAAASFLGIDKSNVSRMRSGEKSVAFRHVLALFEGSPDAFLAFVRPICAELKLAPPKPLAGPTLDAVKTKALALLRREPLLWRVFLEDVERDEGWSRDDVEGAL